MLELSVYEGIPHLLAPVVTDPRKAVVALKWAVREMEERYRKMSKLGVRGVEAFNERVGKAKEKNETLKRTVQTGFDRETGKPLYEDETLELDHMPYIVVVVDEMADLMMISGKEIEGAVQRLAQMARAAGIHLIAADAAAVGRRDHRYDKGELSHAHQLPSDVEDRQPHDPGRTGRRAAARPGRHALYDGRGSHPPRAWTLRHRPRSRRRGALSRRRRVRPNIWTLLQKSRMGTAMIPMVCWAAAANPATSFTTRHSHIVARERKATTSYIQRRLEIGYNRAARLIERMEDEGVISRPNHQGKREVLLPDRDEG